MSERLDAWRKRPRGAWSREIDLDSGIALAAASSFSCRGLLLLPRTGGDFALIAMHREVKSQTYSLTACRRVYTRLLTLRFEGNL